MLHRCYRLTILAIFLLSLYACGGKDSPSAASGARESENTIESFFEDATADIGLDFVHHLEVSGKFPIYEITGAGMAVFDANGDGRLDLLCLENGSFQQPAKDVLYFQGPGGKLRRADDEVGFSGAFSTGCTVGDIDNDGDIDIIVGAVGMDRVYQNDGSGNFKDVSLQMGMKDNGFTTSLTFIDYDLDGFLDVFACRYTSLAEEPPVCSGTLGRQDYCHPRTYKRIDSQLLRNVGGKKFVDVSEKAGIAQKLSYGLGVIVDDFNDDGWPDLYVANDGVPNFMWINNKEGGFTEEALVAGVAVNGQGASESSMGLATGDVDGNGYLDIFTTNLMMESNTLYLGHEGLRFTDGTARSGLSVASLPHTGWGTAFLDPENDGDLDLMIVNGSVVRLEKPNPGAKPGSEWENYAESNLFFENIGDGRLQAASEKAQAPCDSVANHRAMIAVDFDGDGGEDLFINATSEATRFYRNVVKDRGNWIKIDVRDEKLKRAAFGAVVRVYVGDKVLRGLVNSATSYQSACLAPLKFGLGKNPKADRVEVIFPGGEKKTYPGPAHGNTVTLKR